LLEPSGEAETAVLADLRARGLVQDHTDWTALSDRLAVGPTALYCGFDPTADSLHLGNLQGILLLRRFQDAGHIPVALVGGATGMIGDPSGRSVERQFLDTEVLDANREAIGEQLAGLLDVGADGPGMLVDNRTWTEPLTLLEFLRDVGKHVTVNTMLAKDSVRGRIDRETGISFTEFSYMLLQANDFLELHRSHGVDLQVAGSDQWGNITAGVDLIRRRTGDHVHGLTAPLLVRADGSKFGKSEGDNIWLSAERTSPFAMYQYLLNVADDDVTDLLLRLTLVSPEDCVAVRSAHDVDPSQRIGQRRLAAEVTGLVHGVGVLPAVERAGEVLFGSRPITEVDSATLALLATELPSSARSLADVLEADAVDLLADPVVGLAKSRSEVRRNMKGHSINGVDLEQRSSLVGEADLLDGRYVLLGRGRKARHLVVVSD